MVEAGEMLENVPSVARSDAVFAGHGVPVKAQLKEGSGTKNGDTEKVESKNKNRNDKNIVIWGPQLAAPSSKQRRRKGETRSPRSNHGEQSCAEQHCTRWATNVLSKEPGGNTSKHPVHVFLSVHLSAVA